MKVSNLLALALLASHNAKGFTPNQGEKNSNSLAVGFDIPNNSYEILQAPEFKKFNDVLKSIKSSNQLPDYLQKLIESDNTKTVNNLIKWHSSTCPKKIMTSTPGEEMIDGLDSLVVGLWHAIDGLNEKVKIYNDGYFSNMSVEDILHPELKDLHDALSEIITSDNLPNSVKHLIIEGNEKESCENLLNWFFEQNGFKGVQNGNYGKEFTNSMYKLFTALNIFEKTNQRNKELLSTSRSDNGHSNPEHTKKEIKYSYPIAEILEKCTKNREYLEMYVKELTEKLFPHTNNLSSVQYLKF